MEENNVAYMTPEEIRTLDPSLISSMTMTSGETIYVNHDQSEQYLGNICDNCAMNYQQNQNYILRAKKETTVQEGEGGEKIEENVEIDIEAQPEGENKGKKVLRGPDGKLLIDMITGGDLVEGENQEQQIDENANYQQQEEINEQYYDQQGMDQNQVGEEQYVQEQNEEMNYDGNDEQQYYEQEYDSNVNQDPNYYPEEQYDPNYPSEEMNNQIVPEQNVGVEQEYTDQYEQEQGQEYEYPGSDENANQPYEQPEYQPPMNVPQENQQYNPEQEPEPPVEAFDEPPLQEPVQFPSSFQPTQQPNQPSTQKPIQTPVQQFPVAKDIKGFVPKKQGVQIKIGFGLPKQPKGKGPRVPMGLPRKGPFIRPGQGIMMPHGPKNIPQRRQNVGTGGKIIVIKPIGNLLNPHKVMTPIAGMAGKRMGIKTTKPTTFNQGAKRRVAQITGGKPATVFRARKQNAYNNYSYNSQGYGYNYGNNKSNYGVQTYGTGPNYNFHEIVETSDNSKSYVVAKKGGVTVSSDQ